MQGFSKTDIDKIIPAIRVLHERKVEYSYLRNFLMEFE